jgi:hypothetical protein
MSGQIPPRYGAGQDGCPGSWRVGCHDKLSVCGCLPLLDV